MVLRAPIHVTPSDHPAWVNIIETPSFEDFFRYADENYQRGDLGINVWQNNAFEGISAIPQTSTLFKVQKISGPRTALPVRDFENLHIDPQIYATLDPAKYFNGISIRISEQIEGFGTSIYYSDLKDTFSRATHDLLKPSLTKKLKIDAKNHEHDCIHGPLRLRPAQAAIIFKRSAGDHATMHAVPARWGNEGPRSTLLTDLLPQTRVLAAA